MEGKPFSHSPIWLICVVGICTVYLLDAYEAFKVFNFKGHYRKKTLDHFRSFGGYVSIADAVNDNYWLLIYATWPIMLLYFVCTVIHKTSSGYLYQVGYLHWSFLACAIGGVCCHMKWLQSVEEKNLWDAAWSSELGSNTMVIGLVILLTYLAKKSDDLKNSGLGRHLFIMRYLIINIYDIYILHFFVSGFVSVDAYLVAVKDFSPVDSNFYVLLVFSIFQTYFLFSDLRFTNDLTYYLAGGYFTMFVDSFGILLYQMNALESVPHITIINFVISAAMPLLKIYFQSGKSGKQKRK